MSGSPNRSSVLMLVGLSVVVLLLPLLVLLPVLLIGSDQDSCYGDSSGRQSSASRTANNSIPPTYLGLYKKAGQEYGISWNLLAGIGKVESGHGTSRLPGVHSGENYAGAGGPMQFLRPTWDEFGVDGDNNGKKDRYSPADAIPAAGRYLRHNGGDQPSRVRNAVYAYNHSWSYVTLVLSWAKRYAQGGFVIGDDLDAGIQCADAAVGSRGRPDGVVGAKSRIVGNSMTSNMRTILLEIDRKFGPFPTIGCARPGDPQDHGKGNACDFMESMNGQLPTASARSHGDLVAAYATTNARELGISYVIWKQHIWNVRFPGWRRMEDRGSITQNHFDHVHISALGN